MIKFFRWFFGITPSYKSAVAPLKGVRKDLERVSAHMNKQIDKNNKRIEKLNGRNQKADEERNKATAMLEAIANLNSGENKDASN